MPETSIGQDPTFLKLFDQSPDNSIEPPSSNGDGLPVFNPSNFLDEGQERSKQYELGLGNAPQGYSQPSAPNPITATSSKPYASTEDMMSAVTTELHRRNPSFAEKSFLNPSLTPQMYTDKFTSMPEGYVKGVDMEDYYGNKESSWKTFGKGVERLVLSTGIKVGQSVGFIGGLLDPSNWDSDVISKAADNGLSKVFNGFDEQMKNQWLPTYQEAADRNKGFWARAFTDGDFWMDDAVDGLAFMASAWIPGLALSKLGLGLKVTQALSKLRIGVSAAEAAVEGAGETVNYLSKANSVFKTGLDKFTAWGLATGSEAMFEAVDVKNKVYESLSRNPITGALVINPETSMPYTEKEKKTIAGAAAQNTFILNSALLGATNMVELSWLGKAFGGAEQGVARGLTGAATLTEELALPKAPTKFLSKFMASKPGAFVKGGAQGIVAEGFVEENGQLAIQRVNERYGTKGKISNTFNLSEIFSQYGSQTLAALAGKDPEAASNIGIGGLLGVVGGGFHGMTKQKEDLAKSQAVVTTFNSTQESFLKFGNPYKLEEVTTIDEQGNEVKTQKIVRDKNNQPVIDEDKLAGIVSSYASINDALDESTKVDTKFKRDLLRDTAYSQWVIAHVDAGIEDTIFDKLDSVKKASPEDIAKLGFTLNKDVDEQINRYKALTASIISQNKIMNSDILFDNSQDDVSRKKYMTNLAAEQAVHKGLLNDALIDSDKIKNQLINNDNTDLSDGLVEQLNEVEYRIKSQQEVIDQYEKSGINSESMTIAKQILEELKTQKEAILKNNELSVADLKKGEDGLYKYKKDERNEAGVNDQYIRKIKLKGELQNHVRSIGLEWSKFADAINGKKNFLGFFKSDIYDAIVKQQKEEKELKETPKEVTKVEKVTVPFVNEAGEDDSFEFKNGQTYKVEKEDGKFDYYNDVQVSEDGKTISFNLNREGRVEMDIEDAAAFAKKSGWEEFVPKSKKATPVTVKTEHPEDLNSDTYIESSPEEPTYDSNNRKPKFEEVGLNKTFGRHYEEDDVTIIKRAGSDRFFAFTSKFDLSDGNYALEVITKNNDELDIRQSEFNDDDIKVVIVKKVKSKGKTTYEYVDSDNNIIPAEQATKDNIIYNSLVNIKNATPDSIRESYSVDVSTTDEMLQKQIDMHVKYQDDLHKRTKTAPVYLDVTSTSPGVQRVEYTKAIGKKGREIAKAPTEGRVIEDDPDWSNLKSINNPENYIALRVCTRKNGLAKNLLPGRAILQEYYIDKADGKKRYTDKVTRVFNRELTPNEKETIVNALARFSELFGRPKTNPLTTEEKNEFDLILGYLKGMLNWSAPKEGKFPDRYVWISNGLHVGTKTYALNRETIMKNKDKMFNDVFHHVNNKMLWQEESFQTIKFTKDKAVPDGSPYDTYQEYLLAARENGEVPPVYTSLPLLDSEHPQRSNSYITWTDPANTTIAPIGAVERTYATAKPEKTPKSYTKLDKVIDNFINFKIKKITVFNIEIEHVKKGKKLHVQFKNPSTKKVFLSDGYSSVRELKASKYQLRALIYKMTNYKPGVANKVITDKLQTIYDKSKKSPKTKGNIALSMTEEAVLAGETTSTVRSHSYHEKFYKGDGIYKTESNNFINVEYKGLIKYKNGRIFGKDINMSKDDFAKGEGFDSWAQLSKEPKWATKDLIDGQAVNYYEISPVEKIEQTEEEDNTGKTKMQIFQEKLDKVLNPNKKKTTTTTSKETVSRKDQLIKQKELIEKTKDLNKWVDTIFKVLDEAKFNTFMQTYDQALLKKDLGPSLKNVKTEEEATHISLKYFLPKFIDAELAELEGEVPTEVVETGKKTKMELFAEKLNAALSGNKPGGAKEKIEKQPTVPTEIIISEDIESAVANAIQSGSTLTGVLHEKNENTGKFQEQVRATVDIPFTTSATGVKTYNLNAAKSKLKNALIAQLDNEDNESPFRLSVDDIKEKEDFKKLTAFMQSKLPQFPVNVMANMIHGKAWGMFYNGGVYIYKNAGIGTGFHEAFEAVWAAYVTDEQRQTLADEFRKREGNFTNPFSKQTKAYKDASMYDVREMLAEEFSKYVIDNTIDKGLGNTIANFFKELWNSIKSLFGLTIKEKAELNNNINNLFKSINEGEFKNLTPIRELNKVAPAYKAVGKLSQQETSGIIEGLSYYFFKGLFSKGNNINSIIGNLSKEESNELLSSTFEDSFEKVKENLSRLPSIAVQLDAYKEDIYVNFKSNLERYGVGFSELDIDEEDTTDTLGIRDSITIDPRDMTNANIRLLLASIPETTYKNGKAVLVKNSVLQPKLIDSDRLHLTLLNELSNIVPIMDKDGNRKNVLDQMFQKLDDRYKNSKTGIYRKNYSWVASLKILLKYEDVQGNLIDGTNLSKEDMQLKVAFIKSFSNTRTSPEKTIMGEDGYIYNFNPLGNLNTDRVRLNWSNNLKLQIQNKENRIIRLDAQGKMVIDRTNNDYADLVHMLNKPIHLIESLFILQHFGITLSADIDDLVNLSPDIKDHATAILELVRNGEINSVGDLYSNQVIGGRINDLLSMEARFTSEDNVLTYLNAKGEQQYSVGNSSLLSNMINTLNSVKSLDELLYTCPWLGWMDDKDNIQLNPYQQDSDLLKKGGLLFDKKGNRREGVEDQVTYHVISGMGLTDEEGTTTANLQFPERIANKIHYLLNNNVVFSNINSDKSTEFGIGLPGKLMINKKEVSNFLATGTSKLILTKYINQLTSEMAAAHMQKEDPQYIQHYKDEVNNLGHFKDILDKKTIAKFNKEVISEEAIYEGPDAYEQFLNNNRGEITNQITAYVQKTILETAEFLKDFDLFEKSPKKNDDHYVSYAIDNSSLASLLEVDYDLDKRPGEILSSGKSNQVIKYYDADSKENIIKLGITDDQIHIIAGMLAINEELLLAEQHKLIYGHPSMYNDLAKRVSGATGTKESFVEDSDIIAWQDKNMVRNDGKVRSDDAHQMTKIISFKDPNVVSLYYKDILEGTYADMLESGISKKDAEEKSGARFDENDALIGYILDSKGEHTGTAGIYLNLNESDGMAWGMPDAIRDMLFSTSKMTAQQEQQWDYEIAYEKVARSGKDTKDPGYKKYTKDELTAAKAIVKKDPGYIFQVLKPQYFGYADTVGVTHPVYLKHAVQPKFYRHVEGTQYESLYVAAQKNHVDIIGFKSGQKVGVVTDESGELTSIYNDKGGVNIITTKKGYDLPTSIPQLNIYSKFYGIQVEMSSKAKNSVVRGTQITKLIMVNFFNNGQPINEELGKLIADYNDTLRAMIRHGKTEVLKELGLVKTDNGYKTEDLTKLVNILRKEAKNRDLPDNMIDAINALKNQDGEQTLEYSFDTLINREKIDNILNSIVDSRVISEKMNGKPSVQVSSTLYEANPRGFMYLKDGVYKTLTAKEIKSLTEEQKASVRMTSGDLKFYRNENGKITGMDAYISWPFKEITPEQLGLKLENGIYKMPKNGLPGFDKELLEAIGFRIPTQAPNSIENIFIKGFTPATNGDMIVVPSEIVGKAGSDFDIDKLNLYFNNYHVDGVNYSSKEFREFMVNDLIENGGLTPNVADAFINGMRAYTVDDIKKINKSTYSEYGKETKNAKYSLEGSSLDKEDYSQLSKVKESLTRYNAQYKGIKKLKYTEPGTDTKAGLQNKFISITRELISRPENYAQLVTPNTTATLKGLATEINESKIKAGTKIKQDEKSPTFLRSFIGGSVTRERYLTAKRMVGIAALHSTFHSMAQVAGLRLNNTFKTNNIHYLMIKEKGVYDSKKVVNIKLSHHPQLEDKTYNIGHRTDVLGQMISDLFSEAVSGFVDGAKDPFVFDLNFSMNSTGTWFYLQHLGCSEKEIAYFFNQPVMDSFFKEQSKNKSNFKTINNQNLTKEELFYKVIAPYYNRIYKTDLLAEMAKLDALDTPWGLINFKKAVAIKINDINAQFSKFELDDLKTNIDKGNKAEAKMQIAILMNYLEYDTQGRLLSNFMQGISYDNKKTRSIQENQLQVSRWERSKTEEFIANPESILDNTFIGELKEQKEDIFKMFENFFITLTPDLQEAFMPMYDKLNNPDYINSKDNMIDLLNKYQNFILSYVLHTTKFVDSEDREYSLNEMYSDMFMGNKTMAKKLSDYKKSEDPIISDNLIIKELLPIMTDDKSKTDNISLFRNKMDTFQINNVIESLDNLKSHAISIGDTELLDFINDIAVFSILQSGLQTSKIDYKKILSIDVYSKLVKNILDTYSLNPKVDVKDIWRNFHQNNWSNRSIVPKAPSWIKVKNGELKIKASSAIHDYLIKYVRVVSTSEMRKLQKEKRGKEAYEPQLFESTGQLDKNGKYMIYQAVDKRGNGARMTEIYKDVDMMESILEKNKMTKAKPSTTIWSKLIKTIINPGNLEPGELLEDYSQKTGKTMGTETQLPQIVNTQVKVKKIISGGQTGVDRIGLEAGKEIGLQTGGTATPGFATETGKDLTLKDFGVEEISSKLQAGKSGREFYLPRTEQNVLNSDGTVYFATDEDSAGRIATERFAKKHNKSFLLNPTVEQLRSWLALNNIETLNVAGNRGSKLSTQKAEEIKNIIKQALSQPIQTSIGSEVDDVLKQKEDDSEECNKAPF